TAAALEVTALAAAPAAAEDDVRGDDLGAVALFAVFFVARRLQTALDEDALALREELRQGLAALAPERHRVPLRALLAGVVLVEVALGRGEPELQHRLTTGRHLQLRIRAEVPEEHHPVQAFRHDRSFFLLREARQTIAQPSARRQPTAHPPRSKSNAEGTM